MKESYRKPIKKEKNLVYGSYPVELSLQKFSRKVQNVWIQKNIQSDAIQKIKDLCQQYKIIIQEKDKKDLEAYLKHENHQGVIAFTDNLVEYQSIEILNKARCVVILDHIEDPHNLGAILRTCDQFQVDAVIIPKNRSVGVTSTVIKTSSGAALFVPIIQESSLIYVVETLKKMDFWIYTTEMTEGESLEKVQFAEKTAILLGNESQGVSFQLKNKADFKIFIPTEQGRIVDSLNVSVAAGICLYAVKMSQRNQK